MQVRTAEGVFRIYAKSLGDGHLYMRHEKMLTKKKDALGSFTETSVYDTMINTDIDPRNSGGGGAGQ